MHAWILETWLWAAHVTCTVYEVRANAGGQRKHQKIGEN